jgi:hypothetical protein
MFSQLFLCSKGFDLTDSKARKWFNRALDTLVHENVIRKLSAIAEGGRPQRCIQLLDNSPSKWTMKQRLPIL